MKTMQSPFLDPLQSFEIKRITSSDMDKAIHSTDEKLFTARFKSILSSYKIDDLDSMSKKIYVEAEALLDYCRVK